jgi:hypothetical protein
MSECEPCQIGNEAALSKSGCVCCHLAFSFLFGCKIAHSQDTLWPELFAAPAEGFIDETHYLTFGHKHQPL